MSVQLKKLLVYCFLCVIDHFRIRNGSKLNNLVLNASVRLRFLIFVSQAKLKEFLVAFELVVVPDLID